MSQFAREHPEDYEERFDAMVEGADLARKAAKENLVPWTERVPPIPFKPWWEALIGVGRLYRWLVQFDRTPEDVGDFIENAQTWQEDYARLLRWTDQ